MSGTKNMTLQQIKDSLPKYRYLTPGVDVWREGDEYFSKYDGDWIKAVHMSTKILCEMGTLVSYRAVRRPIPDEVLENQAFRLRFPNAGNRAGTADEHRECGGAKNWAKQTRAGDLYSKWLGGQLT